MPKQPSDLYFDPETGYFMLQLNKEDAGWRDHAIRYKGKTFQPKDEVHITIISSGTMQAVEKSLKANPGLAGQIRQAIQEADWSYELKDRWHHVVEDSEEGHAESIIRMVDVPSLGRFYQRLEGMLDEQFEAPPAHVTLYWIGDPKGIGIATRAEFEKLVRGEVSPDEIRRA